MDENPIVDIDTTTDESPVISAEELQEKYAKLEEQNRQLYERAKKAEEKAKEVRTVNKSPEEYQDIIKRLNQTQLMAKGHSEAEIEIIERVARDTGADPLEVANRKYVQAEIAEYREAQRVANATPNNGGRADGVRKDADYYLSKDQLPDDGEILRQIIAKKAGTAYRPLK